MAFGRVVWPGEGRPVILDPSGNEAPWFLEMMIKRAYELALAERDATPFSWWPRED